VKRRRPWWVLALPWATTIVIVGLQELLARAKAIPEEIPPFSETVAAVWQMMIQKPSALNATSYFWRDLGNTMAQFGIGLAIGVAVGLVLGILIGVLPVVNQLVRYVFEFLRFTPAVVYIPILIVVIGATPQLAATLAAVGSVWPVMYQTYYGVVGVSQVLKDTGAVFGLKWYQRLWRITIPSLSPFLATGIRLAAAHALVVVVAVGIIANINKTTGSDLETYAQNGVFPRMYGLILLLGIIGFLINWAIERIERRQLHWHAAYREKSA